MKALVYIEVDVPYCALDYGVLPCQAVLDYAGYRPAPVRFDGIGDYLTRGAGLTGAADGKTFTLSFWIRLQALPGSAAQIFCGATTVGGATLRFRATLGSVGKVRIVAADAAGATVLDIESGALTIGRWAHILCSVDLADTAKRWLYRDDLSDLATVTTYTNANIDLTLADWAVGADPGGGNKLDADLADLWFNPGTYLDLSVTGNRRLFIDAAGRPVDLGANGATPTGSAPEVFLAGALPGWIENKGTGGGFTEQGALDPSLFTTGPIKCFNSLGTCQDLANFDEVTQTYRFAIDTGYLPADIPAIPIVTGVQLNAGTMSLGKDLGTRSSLTVTFRDRPHSDTGPGFDKYLADRPYDPFKQGTFWGKWRARHPFLQGRPIRVIRGLLGQALGDMDVRHYVVESFQAAADGTYTLTAKDVLKLADGDRAQAPVLSNGYLAANITAAATSATLSPTGIGNAEYPASGLVAIGGREICAFTRAGDALTLTRAQKGTTAIAHQAEDRVQVCLEFNAEKPSQIIRDLLVDFAGVDEAFIPIHDWDQEVDTYLQRLYTAVIAEPTSVNQLVSEVIEQAGLALGWDDAAQTIRLQVLRQITTDARLFDERTWMEGTFNKAEQPDTRVSQVWTYFGQINPLEKRDDPANYRSTAISQDPNAAFIDQPAAIRKIYSRWIPALGRSTALRLNDIILGRFSTPPRKFRFDLFRPGREAVVLGGGYRLEHATIQDATGARANLPIQVVRLNPSSDRYQVEAEEANWLPFDDAFLTTRTIVIGTGTNNFNLRTAHDSLFPAPTAQDVAAGVEVLCIINSGVTVGATSTTVRAFDVGSWPTGMPITIRNNGRIQGRGGNGGAGGLYPNRGGNGGVGGKALYTRHPITLENAGTIYGGGGGGGGGGADFDQGLYSHAGGGGGGGAGTNPGTGGAGGSGTVAGAVVVPGLPGSAGTANAGGQGGQGGGSGHPSGAYTAGGNGGGPGQAGQNGQPGESGKFPTPGGTGGQPGAAIDGVSFCTITVPGTRAGPEIN